MLPFDESETPGFTATAAQLANGNATQGCAFPTWGNPERRKLNEVIVSVNMMMAAGGFY